MPPLFKCFALRRKKWRKINRTKVGRAASSLAVVKAAKRAVKVAAKAAVAKKAVAVAAVAEAKKAATAN